MTLYNVYAEDDTILCPQHRGLTEEELRELALSCYQDLKDDGCLEDLSSSELKNLFKKNKPIEKVISEYEEMLYVKVRTEDEVSKYIKTYEKHTQMLESVICNAISFNTVWKAQDSRNDRKGYYNYSVKPLYFDAEAKVVRYSVVASLMCPSGISDNGIRKHIETEICVIGLNSLSDVVKHCCKAVNSEAKIDYDYYIL